jgi:hypothetical protein
MIFKTEKDRITAYRNAFSTIEGLMVLVDILGTLGFWDTIRPPNLSPEEYNALSLCAKKILGRCGFWQSDNYVNMVRTMLGVPPPKKKRWFERIRK